MRGQPLSTMPERFEVPRAATSFHDCWLAGPATAASATARNCTMAVPASADETFMPPVTSAL